MTVERRSSSLMSLVGRIRYLVGSKPKCHHLVDADGRRDLRTSDEDIEPTIRSEFCARSTRLRAEQSPGSIRVRCGFLVRMVRTEGDKGGLMAAWHETTC